MKTKQTKKDKKQKKEEKDYLFNALLYKTISADKYEQLSVGEKHSILTQNLPDGTKNIISICIRINNIT